MHRSERNKCCPGARNYFIKMHTDKIDRHRIVDGRLKINTFGA